MDKDETSSSEEQAETPTTAEMPIVDMNPQPAREEPSFSGAQVRFLMREMGGYPGQFVHGIPSQQPAHAPRSTAARGKYDHGFGWMHLLSKEVGLKLLFVLCFIALAVNYLVSPYFKQDTDMTSNQLITLQPLLLFVAAALVIANIIVTWRRSHLYTTQQEVIFEVKPFWPLLVLKKQQKAKVRKIDAIGYKQNVIEDAFHMNSGTLTLDTAAQDDKDLHQVKGVKFADRLQEDIG